ncbi:hypothetical protein [Abiotrophia defectiva]
MKKHIILEKANLYKVPTLHQNNRFTFNESIGCWMDENGDAMILYKDSDLGQTKKCDVETGEDQKGE